MPQLSAEWRISIKHHPSGRIPHGRDELIRFPNQQRRWFVRFNGKKSAKIPDGTLSEILTQIRRMMVKISSSKRS